MEYLEVLHYALGPLETNCYVLVHRKTREAVVIDPGAPEITLMQALEPFRVTNILLTHAHFDHIGGVAELKRLTAAQVWIHELEKDWLSDGMKNGSSLWLSEPVTAPPADRLLRGGETLPLLGAEIEVLFTPGHSPGHVSYALDGFVFGGDALFAGSIGRTDLEGGDYDTLMRSIDEKLLSLPDGTVLLPGHGPATTIGAERTSNPFLIR